MGAFDSEKKSTEEKFAEEMAKMKEAIATADGKIRAYELGTLRAKVAAEVGLPSGLIDRLSGETEEDIRGIARLCQRIAEEYYELPFETRREKQMGRVAITASTSFFVPKPFTPFQWCAQARREDIERRQFLIKREISRLKGVDFKYHAMDLSYLEACFALGDRRMADVLEQAFRLGCRFDGWNDQFHYDRWLRRNLYRADIP